MFRDHLSSQDDDQRTTHSRNILTISEPFIQENIQQQGMYSKKKALLFQGLRPFSDQVYNDRKYFTVLYCTVPSAITAPGEKAFTEQYAGTNHPSRSGVVICSFFKRLETDIRLFVALALYGDCRNENDGKPCWGRRQWNPDNAADSENPGQVPATSRHDRGGMQAVRLRGGRVYRWVFQRDTGGRLMGCGGFSSPVPSSGGRWSPPGEMFDDAVDVTWAIFLASPSSPERLPRGRSFGSEKDDT